MLCSSVTTDNFFFKAAIIIVTNFCKLVHRKTFALTTYCCFWKKDWKLKRKEDEIIGSKKESYFRTLFGPLHGKQGNFEAIVFSKQLSFSGSKVYPLKRNIKDLQRICFLFVDWENWKFFFFVEEIFRVSFFLVFNWTFIYRL